MSKRTKSVNQIYFTKDHEMVRRAVRDFVNKEINPNMDEWEENWYDLAFLEELGHVHGLGIPMAIWVQTHMATPAIADYGSEYLKETYLRAAVSGDMVSSIAVTEPGAGSDVAAIQTTAKKDGGSYIMNGSKTYITNGTQADFLTLLARTSDDPGYHSFSLFVVPTDLPGFQVGRKLDKLGVWCSDTAELFFDNLSIPAYRLKT
jgi:citronellyl-CoA dehydrogenase